MTSGIPEYFQLSLFWKKRKQTIGETAAFCIEVLRLLNETDPEFEEAFFLLSNNDCLKIEFKDGNAVKTLVEVFIENNRKEILRYNRNAVIDEHFSEDVGFIYHFYNRPDKGNRYSLQLTLGASLSSVSNSVLLEFPKEKKIRYEFISRLFSSLIKMAQPDYGFVMSRKIARHQKLPEYFFGWMNYFARHIQLPPIPADYEVQQVDDWGTLIIVTKDDFDSVNNPVHHEKAMGLVNLFRQYNIMRN